VLAFKHAAGTLAAAVPVVFCTARTTPALEAVLLAGSVAFTVMVILDAGVDEDVRTVRVALPVPPSIEVGVTLAVRVPSLEVALNETVPVNPFCPCTLIV
jgi:hypothetical protein